MYKFILYFFVVLLKINLLILEWYASERLILMNIRYFNWLKAIGLMSTCQGTIGIGSIFSGSSSLEVN